MLGLNATLEDNVIPLPEHSSEVCSLLQILTGTAGDVDDFRADFKSSLRLYSLASKYQIVGGSLQWISNLLERFIKANPLECFAAACERVPTDKRIAKMSIKSFPLPPATPFSESDASRNGRAHLEDSCGHLKFSQKINPAQWRRQYIQRLGLLNYAAYVSSFGSCYLARRSIPADGTQILGVLAEEFCAELEDE